MLLNVGKAISLLTMKSLEKQLQFGLGILLLSLFLGQLIIANLSTRKILSEFVTSRLGLDAKRIVDSLKFTKNTTVIRWRRLNPVYNTAYSGHYYAIKLEPKNQSAKSAKSDKGIEQQTILSPSLQNTKLPLNASKLPVILHDVNGPEGQHLIVLTQKYQRNDHTIIISVAENMSLLIKQRKHFTWVFIAIGIIGFLLMIALQSYILRRLFKHLDKSRNEIKNIESGKQQLLSENVPSEIYPLVKEFNHSLSLMQKRLERSRNSLGNLAHALKTPLSILFQALDDDGNSKGVIADKKQAKLQAERIRQLMERELKRARMAGLGNSSHRFEPHEELPVLSDVLKQAHKRSKLEIAFVIDEKVTTFGDREDMLELFGNLLDNACKWAKSQVLCEINKNPKNNFINICIEDDGTGQTDDELLNLTQRGIRLDESVDGHGLGLAICKDIVKLYGGALSFERSTKLGGLLVLIELPSRL